MTSRMLAFVCYIMALSAIIFTSVSGERWPLWFAVTMMVFGLIVGIGDALEKQ